MSRRLRLRAQVDLGGGEADFLSGFFPHRRRQLLSLEVPRVTFHLYTAST